MLRSKLVLFFIFFPSLFFGQKEGNVWYFGHRAGIDFNSGAAITNSNGALTVTENSTSICNKSTGQLLFYTDGDTVWDRNHVPMLNGTGLNGGNSCLQGLLIVPKPKSDSLYYIFTIPDYESANFSLEYSIVNIRLNNGLGSVVSKNNIVVPGINFTEKIDATYHANGMDIWLVAHEYNSNRYISFLLTSTGISAPIYSNVGYTIVPGFGGSESTKIGGLKISPNAKKLASTVFGSRVVEICDFDNCSGIVSNSITKSSGNLKAGLEFSPDNTKLYVNENDKVVQYDVTQGLNIFNTGITVMNAGSDINYYLGMELGPNGKIYIARSINNTDPPYIDTIAVINNPNAAGLACNAVDRGLALQVNTAVWEGMTHVFLNDFNVSNLNLSVTSDTTVCEGDSVLLEALTGTDYCWQNDYGDIVGGSSQVMVTPDSTTKYTVLVSNGCAFDTASVIVNVVPYPLVTLENEVRISAGENASLQASGGVFYNWQPVTSLSCFSCAEPIASPTSTTTYSVEACSSNGCCVIDTIRVVVEDQTKLAGIYIPNVFSPNGDGENDVFKVYGEYEYMSLKIFNRWGELVYSEEGESPAWDGKVNAKDANSAVFAYSIVVRNGDEVSDHFGNLILIR